jgi:TolB-like protein/Flp pilus assembly protein TadD
VLVSVFNELKRRNVLRVAAAYVVVAWAIIQVTVTLRELFPGTPLWIGQTLSVLLALGVVPILLFAWFYELTPEGFKRDSEVGDNRSYADATGRKLIYVTVAAVIIGVVFFAWTRDPEEPLVVQSTPAQEITANSVAVLPFVNMSADPDNEYFSDGLTETLLHLLAQVRDLKVAARTSSFAFKGKDTDIRAIAITLGVAHVLEGSVQRVGDRIRITAQLIRAADGFHVWSGNYDRDLIDVFDLQDEIADQVGIQLLASVLNPAEAVRQRGLGTRNFQAYDLYLRARAEMHRANFAALQSADGYLRAALVEDPDFVDAKAQLASLLDLQVSVGMRPFAEVETEYTTLLSEILAMDPDHPQARSMQINARAEQAMEKGDFSGMKDLESELRAVVVAAPEDVDVRMAMASIVRVMGKGEEAIAILEDALKIDPLNPFLYEFLASLYEQMKDHESARDYIRRSLEIEPGAPNPWLFLARLEWRLGNAVPAIDAYLNAQSIDALDLEIPGHIADMLYSLGLPEEAKEFHQRVSHMEPGSEFAQRLDLLRVVSLGEMSDAAQMARDIIAGDPPDRQWAWRTAWRVLLFTSHARGTVLEDIALMDEHAQGFSNLDTVEVTGRVTSLRSNNIDVLAAVKTIAELRDFRKRVNAHFQQLNARIEDFPLIHIDWNIINGDPAAAKQIALDDLFSKSATRVSLWQLRFARPFMAEFISDPAIQEALEGWARQEERMRAEVLDYLRNRNER